MIDEEKLRKPISPSRVQSRLYCARSWELRYIHGVRGPESRPAKLGSLWHERIEHALTQGKSPRIPKKMLDTYNIAIEKFNPSNRVMTEVELFGDLLNKKVTGIIDYIDIDKSIIADWKSGSPYPDYSTQAWMYYRLTEQNYGIKPDVYFVYLKAGKIKKVSKKELFKGYNHFCDYVDFLNNMTKVKERYSPDDRRCRYCGYGAICLLEEGL